MTAAAPEAPVEILDEPDHSGELRLRFPVLVIEGLDTSDGRYIEPGALAPRALPLSLLAQPESSHGGDEPGPAIVVGRLDTMERHPGPEVVSRRTGEPFPEGTFVWSATGVIDANHPVADLVRRGFLRGVSVDLAGMDYEVVGEDGFVDDENPRRQLITYKAEVAAATLVPIPAFGDAYGELADESEPPAPVTAEDLPEGLLASAVPAWRSREVGDPVALVAAADEGMPVRIPPDAVEQLTAVIDSGEERDATELATAIVEHIALEWALTEPVPADELPDTTVTADAALADEVKIPAEEVELAGDPAEPQPCEFGDEPATRSLLYREGTAYVPTCDEHEQRARDELAAAGETITEVVEIGPLADEEIDAPAMAEIGDDVEPDEDDEDDVGLPDAPQPCEYGPEPAVMSLLYAGGERFVPVCGEHEQQAREQIAADGGEVTGVVEIEQPDDEGATEETPA